MNKKYIVFILQGGKGGTLEYIKMLLSHLNSNKYDITVICHGEAYEDLNNLGYKTHCVEMYREISFIKDFMSFKNVFSYLRNNKIDIVYSHSSKAGVIGRLAALLLKIPNIYIPQGWSFNMNVGKVKKWLYIIIEQVAAKFTDKIIAISEAEYNDAIARRIADESKAVLITSGIDLDRYDKREGNGDLKRSNGIPRNYKVVGMIGRLTEQKSPQTFIQIARIVTVSYPDCKFILVGDGELRDELEKLVINLKLRQNIIFTGWVKDPENYISIMDVGVLTSKWEGFGLVLAEMMACGKPVVASSVDGIPFVVEDNIDGFLCKPDDAEEFALHVLKLLSDADLYKKMSKNAYQHAREKFDLKRVIKQHEEIFDSL